MSIHKRTDRGGTNWRVHYRIGGRQRTRTFDRKADAVQFDALMKRRRQLGPLLTAELERESMTLEGFVRGPWRKQATTLAEPTRHKYAWALEKHLADLLDEPLLALDVARLAAHQGLMLERGCTPSTVREVLARLSGVLQPLPARLHTGQLGPADEQGAGRSQGGGQGAGTGGAGAAHCGHHRPRPRHHAARRPPGAATHRSPLGPVVRARGRPVHHRPQPHEAHRRADARDRRARGHAPRAAGVAHGVGSPGDDEPIVGELSMNALKLWGRRHLPAGFRVLDLRHSHASALHYAGFTVPEAARRMGHGPALHVETYAHIIDSISGRRYEGLDELISVARAELVLPQRYPDAGEAR